MQEKEIQTMMEEFLGRLGVSFEEVEWVPFPAHALLNIKTNESALLIGPHGDTLQSLSIVFKRMLEQRFKEAEKDISCLVDVNGYRRTRLEEIQQGAKMLAERVRSLHSRAELSPMNAYERMIVHATFTEDPDVTTISEGEGKERHVVLVHR